MCVLSNPLILTKGLFKGLVSSFKAVTKLRAMLAKRVNITANTKAGAPTLSVQVKSKRLYRLEKVL